MLDLAPRSGPPRAPLAINVGCRRADLSLTQGPPPASLQSSRAGRLHDCVVVEGNRARPRTSWVASSGWPLLQRSLAGRLHDCFIVKGNRARPADLSLTQGPPPASLQSSRAGRLHDCVVVEGNRARPRTSWVASCGWPLLQRSLAGRLHDCIIVKGNRARPRSSLVAPGGWRRVLPCTPPALNVECWPTMLGS